MPGELTEVTEIATACGMMQPGLRGEIATRPMELLNVSDEAWDRFVRAWREHRHQAAFTTAFENGRAFLEADDALRGRPPRRIEWRGPHQVPGDDVIPADLRVDHVYLVSCKYLSKILLNPGPARLFDSLLVGDQRRSVNWFAECAPDELQTFYEACVRANELVDLPQSVLDLDRSQQGVLKVALSGRLLPPAAAEAWARLCGVVSERSADRWREALGDRRSQARLLWRLLRISGVAYFILGTSSTSSHRFRVDSAWDWMQAYDLTRFTISPRVAGQPEVAWEATIRVKGDSSLTAVHGHVEVRWSHGRFYGVPEAKVYLDSPFDEVPGYHRLT